MMFTKTYLISAGVITLFSLLGGGLYSFYRALEVRDKEISSLREELLNKHVEIAKRNYELQQQANEFHAFNSKRHEFEKSLINKYSVPTTNGNPCDTGLLDSLLRKSFGNEY